MNRCLRTVWLWGGVAGLPIMAATAMAVPSKTGGLQLHKESILLQELLPIVLACAVWGPDWQGLTARLQSVGHSHQIGCVLVLAP